MVVDWDLVIKLAGPILGALVGAGAKHLLDSRPRVVAFLGHVSGIRLIRGNEPLDVGSHSVVLRNAGSKAANNVRIGHNILPDFQVFPDIDFTVHDLPGGEKEIRIPVLVPKKQITITYLYFPPLTWEQVNTHLETDDGSIKILNVLPTVQLSKPVTTVLWALLGMGLLTALYLAILIIKWVSGA